MSRRAVKAYLVFLLTGIFIYLSSWGMSQAGWISQLPSFTIHTLLFFFGITSLLYKYITQFSNYGDAAETQLYLGSIVLKLLVACGFLWVMSIADRPHLTSNTVLLLVSYILFTCVEITQLIAAKKD